jgi:rfaE bifunctional protein kinase chain/domain
MSVDNKIWWLSQSQGLQREFINKNIVLAYGHFNIIHPGHIRYLGHAKKLGESLFVALEGDQALSSSGRTHNFSASDRALGLALLNIVDGIVVLDNGNLHKVIKLLKPKILVLGNEFKTKKDNLLLDALQLLHQQHGKIVYHAGDVQYTSNEQLEEEHRVLISEKKRHFQDACKRQNVELHNLRYAIEQFSKARLIVLGDTIVDQYIACDPIGMSSEAPVLVVRELKAREFLGGAAIVAAHASSLGCQCHYLSVVGQDEKARKVSKELSRLGLEHTLIPDESRTTSFKIRYMIEKQKIFRVSQLHEHSLSIDIESQIIESLRELAPHYDGILVSDFVYGVITKNVLKELIHLAKKFKLNLFGDLQCSSQIGDIGKFENFNMLTPTEKEIRISQRNREDGVEWIANNFIRQTNTENLVIKLGGEGFIIYNKDQNDFINSQHFPALDPNPIDVAGAGDSLIACMAVSLCAGNTPMVSAALGACMASIAVQNLGNLPVKKSELQQRINQIYDTDQTLMY